MSGSGKQELPVGVEKYGKQGQATALKIDRAVRKVDGSWRHFSQDVWLGRQVVGADGVCGAMAAIFLFRAKKRSGNFITYLDSKEGREEVMNLWTTQKAVPGWQTTYLSGAGLTQRYARMGDMVSQICMLVKINGYYSLGLSDWTGKFNSKEDALLAGSKGSFHGLAIVTDGDIHALFDANWGYGIFPDADKLSEFLNDYWEFEYKNLIGSALLDRYS